MKERFPIQSPYWIRSGEKRSIPWDAIAPHEAQAMRNHGGQTLARLAQRGGLGPNEALCILADKQYDGPTFRLPQDKAAYEAWDADRWEALQIKTLTASPTAEPSELPAPPADMADS